MDSASVRPNASYIVTNIIHDYPDPSTERRWREFLRSIRWASHFISPEYFLDPKMKGKRPFAILAEHGGEIVACLTGWHEKSHVVSGMPTHPQLAIQEGPDSYLVEQSLIDSLLGESKRSSITVYSWSKRKAFDDMKFWTRQINSTYTIDLLLDDAVLFQQLDSKKRYQIRYAIKHGVEVREAHEEDLPRFYQLLKATYKRLASEVPLQIDEILKPETNRKLFIASRNGECIGGTFVRYQSGGLAEYSENASFPEFWRFRPNDLLLWEGIKWSKSAGCNTFNLGGHNQFKRKFGGKLRPIFCMSLDRSLFSWRHATEYLEMFARRLYRSTKSLFERFKKQFLS